MTDEKCPKCGLCGGPMSKNPHPRAGDPKDLAVGTVFVCIPCLAKTRHKWAGRAWRAERQVAQLQAENERLRAEFLDDSEELFFCLAHLCTQGNLAGWWDSMAQRSATDTGDRLVKAGRFERYPEGYGRRWFYRRACKAAKAAKESET